MPTKTIKSITNMLRDLKENMNIMKDKWKIDVFGEENLLD